MSNLAISTKRHNKAIAANSINLPKKSRKTNKEKKESDMEKIHMCLGCTNTQCAGYCEKMRG